MSGRGHIPVVRQMRQKGFNFLPAHIGWVPHVMPANEIFDPVRVRLLRTNAVMQIAYAFPHLVQQSHGLKSWLAGFRDLVSTGHKNSICMQALYAREILGNIGD